MSIPCDCVQCGGTDELAMCDNALMEARIGLTKAEQRIDALKITLAIILGLIVLINSIY